MGWIHWLAYQRIQGAQVVAVCDTNEKRLSGDWTEIQGNFGPPGENVDLSDIACCSDIYQFCELDFDVLDICLPPALHLPLIKQAAKNGKHVFSEKPLSLTLEDCETAVDACGQANRILQVGHVLPFFPEYAKAREIIESGQHGEIRAANFKRVISDPVWLKDFYDPNKIGGPLLDLNVHDAHFIRLACGQPTGVFATGLMQDEVVRYCQSVFDFADGEQTVAAIGGVIDQQARPFMHGFEIQLESATLHFEYAALNGTDDELLPMKLMIDDHVEYLDVGNGDPVEAFVAEIQEMVTSLETGRASPILSGNLARDAIKICQAVSLSVRERRRVEIC